jgi:hypothetical protein
MNHMADLPIACSLTHADLEAKRGDLLPGLLRHSSATVETPAGYRYRFDTAPDGLSAIAAAVEGERQCCRFLRFSITLEPNLGPIWVDVSGPEGTKTFLADLLRER